METESIMHEIANPEAELDEACRGPLDFAEKGRYSWPVALRVARRLLDIARLLAPLAKTGEAVEEMPPGFFIGNGLYGSDEWVVICEDEDDGHLFPHINAKDAVSAVSLAHALGAIAPRRGRAMPNNWTAMDWQAVTVRWFDCGVGIVCPCGADLVVDADSGDAECSCGRAYRLACTLHTRAPAAKGEGDE